MYKWKTKSEVGERGWEDREGVVELAVVRRGIGVGGGKWDGEEFWVHMMENHLCPTPFLICIIVKSKAGERGGKWG